MTFKLPEPAKKVYASHKNTASVRSGTEMSGYLKETWFTEAQMRQAYEQGCAEVLAELQREQADNVAMSMLADEYKAELAEANATIEYQSETWHIQDAYITSLQSKVAALESLLEELTTGDAELCMKKPDHPQALPQWARTIANKVYSLAPGAAPKPTESANAEDMKVYKAISDNYLNSVAAPAQWMKDVLATGVAVTVGGVPVDPFSIYKEAAPAAQRLSDAEIDSVITAQGFASGRLQKTVRAIETAFAEKNGITLEQQA